jgi:hypothetical protein
VPAKSFILALALFLSIFLTACATLPDTKSLIREIEYKYPVPEISGSQGELSLEGGRQSSMSLRRRPVPRIF